MVILEVMQLAVLIVLVIALFSGRYYLSGYSNEKGKNLATSEDIEKITQQVESVKSSIQTLAKLRIDYEQQRREWLLLFYDSGVEFLYEKIAVNFGEMPLDEGRSLFEFQKSFHVLVSSLVRGHQRIVLYFSQDHFLHKSATEVLMLAIKSRIVLNNRFGDVKAALLNEELALKSGDRERLEAAVQIANEANTRFWDEMRPVADEFQSSLGEYQRQLNMFLQAASDE